MGPTLARMARRAADLAGSPRRVVGVARFSEPALEAWLHAQRIETIRCDLLDRARGRAAPRCAARGLHGGAEVRHRRGQRVVDVGDERASFPRDRASGMQARASSRSRPGTCTADAAWRRRVARRRDPLAPVGRVRDVAASRASACSRHLSARPGRASPSCASTTPTSCATACSSTGARVLAGRARRSDDGLRERDLAGRRERDGAALRSRTRRRRAFDRQRRRDLRRSRVRERLRPSSARLLDVAVTLHGHGSARRAAEQRLGGWRSVLGRPRVGIERLIAWTADWVRARRPLLGKPTHFEVARRTILMSAFPPVRQRHFATAASFPRIRSRSPRPARSTSAASARSPATTSPPAPADSPSACTRRNSRSAIPRSDSSSRCSTLAAEEMDRHDSSRGPRRSSRDRRRLRPTPTQAARRSEHLRRARLPRRTPQPRGAGATRPKSGSRALPRVGERAPARRLLPAAVRRRPAAVAMAFWRRFAEIPHVVRDQDRAVQPVSDDRRGAGGRRCRSRRHRPLHRKRRSHRRRPADAVSASPRRHGPVERRIVGGLLGHWAVWTQAGRRNCWSDASRRRALEAVPADLLLGGHRE